LGSAFLALSGYDCMSSGGMTTGYGRPVHEGCDRPFTAAARTPAAADPGDRPGQAGTAAGGPVPDRRRGYAA